MAASRVGSPASGSGTTTITPSLPQAATAGNLLLFSVFASANASAVAPSCSTPSGWSVATSQGNGNITDNVTSQLWVFYKQAAGGDAAPTVTLTGSTNATWVTEEWSGVQAVADGGSTGSSSTVGASNTATGGNQASTATTNATDFVWCATGAYVAAGSTSPTATWTVATADAAATTITNQQTMASGQYSTSSAGAQTPSSTIALSSGTVRNHILIAAAFQLIISGSGSSSSHSTGTLYVTPTGTGTVRALSATASTAASNTKVQNASALAVVTQVIPEATSTTGASAPSGTTPLPTQYWEIALSAEQVVLDAQTVTVTINVTGSRAETVLQATAYATLYADTTNIGSAASANFLPTTTAQDVTISVPISSATIPAGGKLRLAMVMTIPPQTLTTQTITYNYNTTGTRMSSITYKIAATRSLSATTALTVTMARLIAAFRIASAASTGTSTLARAVTFVRLLTSASTGTGSLVKTVSKRATTATTGTSALVKMVGKPLAVTATGTAARVIKMVGKPLAFTATATGTLARAVTFARTYSTTSTGTATLVKQVGKTLAASATGTAVRTYVIGKLAAVTATGTAQRVIKMVGKPLSFTAAGSPVMTRSVIAARSFATSATSTAKMLVTLADTVLARLAGGATTVIKKLIVVLDD